ncbi:outer membrane assembly lipoprotein YfgL [Nitrosococcus oceani AFC27]|uniref:Outer membrane protein assembly factor BamB n=1 Tax=Nitrosococcus oceani C-27 TaxID=314279 RepID=A0A0E2Z9D5_9GAMM|nr:outer membrane protein assembly factor BamB [Nitrosococcus oceani]EDZ68005.1 outer membrane assembly lipoprotein YfgL [Nitrosococcus oceani AFC27]KFI20310.1 pyrrolo-quinoline quinone [Nitrosococcus oceani C-27]GEM20208.1 outer membrane protein assembly factor BamB [Nitrosococcus oceani]
MFRFGLDKIVGKRRLDRAVFFNLLFFLLTGCELLQEYLPEPDTSEPPMALVEFVPEVGVEVLWSAKVGKGTRDRYLRLPLSIIGDKVVAADYGGQVSAFDAQTGEKAWEIKLDLPITGGPGGSDDLVVLGTEEAEVIALDAADGSPVWRTSVSSEILSAPSVADGVVVIRSGDDQVYGLDARDGSRLWAYQHNVPILTLRGVAAPIVVDRKAIIGLAGGKLVALSLEDGQLLWERAIVVPRGRTELDRLADIDSKPAVYGGYLYTVTYNGRIAALWLADGDILWTREMSSYAGIGTDGESLYVTDMEGSIWALESRTGASLWRQSKLLRRQPTAPTSYQNYVVVGDSAGYVHWMAKEDGHFVARIEVDKKGIVNAPLVLDDILYVNSQGGILKAIKIAG